MIKLEYRKQEWELDGKFTVRQAIEELGLNPEALLVVRDGELITEDTRLRDGDEIRLVAVISGGLGGLPGTAFSFSVNLSRSRNAVA
jgi:sulfur carrier protein ThiS